MELKLILMYLVNNRSSSNRTFMELKYGFTKVAYWDIEF